MNQLSVTVTDRPRRGYRAKIIASFAVILVVAGSVAVGIRYHSTHQPKGSESSGVVPRPECQLDESTLAQTQTHNFERGRAEGRAADSGVEAPDFTAVCGWGQVEGVDGVDLRRLSYAISRYDGADGIGRAKHTFAFDEEFPTVLGLGNGSGVAGIGDEAFFSPTGAPGAATTVGLVVRRGNLILNIGLAGKDQGFLWLTEMPPAEGKRLTVLVAQDLLRRNLSHAS